MKRKEVMIRVMELPLLISKITSEGLTENRVVKEKTMNEELPNILIDSVPFILEHKWLREWNSGNALFKADMHDEGHFYWFEFDRNKRSITRGMEQFDAPAENRTRIILHRGLFERIDYYRTYHHGGFNMDSPIKKDGYELLPDAVAAHLVAALRGSGIKYGDPIPRELVLEILEKMPAALKVQERWQKPGPKKNKGQRP